MINVKTPDDLDRLSAEYDDLLLIFTQPSWCIPCQRLAPHLEAAEDKTDIPFVVIDEETDPDIAAAWSVMGVPTMILWHVGRGGFKTVQSRTSIKILKELAS